MESFLHGLNNQSNMHGDEATFLGLLLDETSAKFENEGQIQMDKSKPCFIRIID